MKRALLTFAASLAAIAVLPTMAMGANAKVTLGASLRLITYGQQTTLNGTISSQKANERATLQSRDCTSPNGAFTEATTLSTGANGAFSTTQTPLYSTTYQAAWKSATSNQVLVRVRPYIKFRKLSAHRYRVRVRAAQDLQHHFAAFQRMRSHHWVTLKRLRLLGITSIGVNQQTFVAGKTFRSHVKRGVHLRILMRDSWSGPCYAAGTSRVIHA